MSEQTTGTDGQTAVPGAEPGAGGAPSGQAAPGGVPGGQATPGGVVPPDARIAKISFDGVDAPVTYQPVPDFYFQINPPDAHPAIFVPVGATPNQITALVDRNLPLVRELRVEMQKRYQRNKSVACRYRTADIAYMLGRPFFLRVFSSGSSGTIRHAARGRATSSARFYPEVSLLDLFVMQTSDYDQRRQAFMSWARPILARNVPVLAEQAAHGAGLQLRLPSTVRIRQGLKDDLIHIDRAKDTLWVSEALVPFPPGCIVYAFLRQATRDLPPDQRQQAIERACPDWQVSSTLLRDKDCVFYQQ